MKLQNRIYRSLSMVVAYVIASATFAYSSNIMVTVSNSTSKLRESETIEIPIEKFKGKLVIDGSQKFVVRNTKSGEEIPSQLTHDKLLIFQTTLKDGESAKYEISNGQPKQYEPKVFGAQYPNRIDDFAWENDRIAFRVYGPKLQELDQKAYGNDIWVKSVSDLIVDYRYDLALNPATLQKIYNLRKNKKIKEAGALAGATSFHVDHGNGMDQYTVGPTLGAGTAALMNGDKIVYPYCYKDYEILDRGPIRFSVKLTYNPLTVGENKGVVETRTISIDAGVQFNKTTLHFSNLKKKTPIISGIIMSDKGKKSQYTTSKKGGYAAYATPPDPGKEKIQGIIYIGTIFGDATTKAEPYYFSDEESKTLRIKKTGYSAVFGEYKPDQIFTYYWGAAWSKYNFSSYKEWVEYVDNFSQRVKRPLKVKLK